MRVECAVLSILRVRMERPLRFAARRLRCELEGLERRAAGEAAGRIWSARGSLDGFESLATHPRLTLMGTLSPRRNECLAIASAASNRTRRAGHRLLRWRPW